MNPDCQANSSIGANVFLMDSVPANSLVRELPAQMDDHRGSSLSRKETDRLCFPVRVVWMFIFEFSNFYPSDYEYGGDFMANLARF
jgi:hypothetical protein